MALGSPSKSVCNPSGMAMGCLCATVSNKLLLRVVRLHSRPPLPQSAAFCLFLHPGGRSTAKGGIRGCFPPPFAGGQLPTLPACSLQWGRRSLLAGQTAKTQHRLLKDLWVFFKAPEIPIGFASVPTLPAPPPPPAPSPPPALAPVVPGAETALVQAAGKGASL